MAGRQRREKKQEEYVEDFRREVLGWLAFDEALPPSRIVGFLLVWVALVLLTIDMIRAARAGRRASLVAA